MEKTKLLTLVIVCFMVFGLLVCSSNGKQALAAEKQTDYTLKLAFAANESTSMGKSAYLIKELLDKKSNGKIKVEIYPNSQLGGDRELLEGCQAGNISMVGQTTAPQVSFIPQLAVFDLPNVFTDIDTSLKVLSGTFKDKVSQYYEKAGFKLIQMVPVGFREMSSNKPVRKFEDFKGIKIRTMENPYHMAYWKALGANPTPLAFSELYIALQQNTVVAQENPPEALIFSKLYEQQKYLINTHHIMFIATIIMNKALYDGMPTEYKKMLNEAMKEGGEYQVKLSIEMTTQAVQKLKDLGKEVIDLPPVELKKMQEAAKPIYDMVRKAVGDDLVDTLLKEYAAASKK